MKYLIVLALLTMSFSGCSLKWFKAKKDHYHFSGFTSYNKPPKVKLEVLLSCKGKTKLEGDYELIGNCVDLRDVENLIVRTKILEKIVDNYDRDIKSYQKIGKGE